MTEFEFVQELMKQPDFSMNSVCRLVDKTRLKKEYLAVLRRNMMNTGLVSREGYKFTDKFVEWLIENVAKVVKLSSESFRDKEKDVFPKNINISESKKYKVDKDQFLAKFEEFKNVSNVAAEVARELKVSESHVYYLMRAHGIKTKKEIAEAAKAEAKKVMHEKAAELMEKAKSGNILDRKPTVISPTQKNIEEVRAKRKNEYDNTTAHKDILTGIHELYIKKNRDYGDSFHATFVDFGMASALVRISDKWNRIKSLSKQPAQVADETIRDTLIDLANYSLMTVMELDRLKDEGSNDVA